MQTNNPKRKLNEINTSESIYLSEYKLNIPKNSEIDDAKLQPFDELLPLVAKEFANLNITKICEAYKPILDEFYELSANYRHNKPVYNSYLEKFITEICDIYKIQRTMLLVHSDKYTTNDWGNVYWLFLHYSSILVNYAYEQGKITYFLNFPLIVYNIDSILPCSKCIGHYQQIKNSFNVKNVIKQMAFGSNINGLLKFHNIITQNVDNTPEHVNRPNRPLFTHAKFAAKYQCIEMQSEKLQKSKVYEMTYVDWQPKIHNLLTIILATYCPQRYSRTSYNLKRIVYNADKSFNNINLNLNNFQFSIYTENELILNSLSSKQIKYCLMRAILQQFQDTSLTDDDLDQLSVYNEAILTLYHEHPEFVKKLIKLNLPDVVHQSENSYILSLEDRAKKRKTM